MPASAPVTDVRDIAHIAYAFKASKALLTALDLGVFRHLAGTAKTSEALSQDTGVPKNRLDMLLAALVSLGLLGKEAERFRNAPACEDYLVQGKRAYFGDYFSLQTDKFIFPAYEHLGALLTKGETPAQWRRYQAIMSDPAEARVFSQGQHSGSLGPAVALAKTIEMGSREDLLDVGGGSGAFTIMLCRKNPSLRATILDFPNAVSVARDYVREAKLDDRVRYEAGDALQVAWSGGHHAVLMSYLFSAVPEAAIGELLRKSFDALVPGGLLIVHDFMLDDDQTGPRDAALWFLTCLYNAPDAAVLTPFGLRERVAAAGFSGIQVRELIPGLTRVLQAFKPH